MPGPSGCIAVGEVLDSYWAEVLLDSGCPFLTGMLALEMLGRRAHNDHPNNFSRSPPYTEDVKWLLGLAAKLGKAQSSTSAEIHFLGFGPWWGKSSPKSATSEIG